MRKRAAPKPIDLTLERDLLAACIDAAQAIGCVPMPNVVVPTVRGATGLGKGSPDLVVAVPGAFRLATGASETAVIFFELKKDAASKRSPAQVKWHSEHANAGLRIHTIRSVREMIDAITALRLGRAA